MRTLFCLALVGLTLSVMAPASAQETLIELDPAQTRVAFTLGATLHTVHGIFRLKSGTIIFDPATGQASGLVVVDATSGDSGNHGRDHKMHKDVLESARYPEITFKPEQVKGQVLPAGDSEAQVLGIMNLHGANHPLTLTFQVHVAGEQLTAAMKFTIPYVSWGLKNPSTFILRVKPTVDIALRVAGQIKNQKAR